MSSFIVDLNEFKKLKQTKKDEITEVFQIEHVKTNKIFSAQIFPSIKGNKNAISNMRLYSYYNSNLSHPSLTKFLGFSPTDFKHENQPVLITEYISNFTLSEIIQQEKNGLHPPNWTDTKKLINLYGIASAILYLSNHNVIHKNIAVENIIETSEFYPKMANFGLQIFETQNYPIQKYGQISIQYFGDAFSFGIVACLIMTGEKPFSEQGQLCLEKLNGIPESYRNLIKSCISTENSEGKQTFVSISEIIGKLKSDPGFITSTVNKEEFDQYVEQFSFFDQNNFKDNINDDIISKLKEEKDEPFSINIPNLDLNLFGKFSPFCDFYPFYYLLTRDKETNKRIVAKIYRKEMFNKLRESSIANDIIREVSILSQLSHPSIVKFIGYSPIDFEGSYKPTIVMEHVYHGSLYYYFLIQNYKISDPLINDTSKLIIIYGVASVMSYLHSIGVVHGNLSSYTVLVDEFFFPKISNFIKSHFVSSYNKSKNSTDDFSKSFDVFNFGKIALELFSNQIIEKHIWNSQQELNIILNQIPPVYKDLIGRCLDQEFEKTPTFDEIVYELKMNQNFVTENVNNEMYRLYIDMIEKQVDGMDTKEIKERILQIQNESFHKYNEKFLLSKKIDFDKIISFNIHTFEKFSKKIGSGGFGKVYLIKEKKLTKIYAAKELTDFTFFSPHFKYIIILNEIDIFSKLFHPCILKTYGFSPFNFKNRPREVIIMDYIKNGSLESLLELERNKGKFSPWNDTMKLINIYGIALAISYLHSKDIIHLDIKPLNILLDDYLFPKLCDFGISKFFSKDENQETQTFTCGTPSFTAPETYSGEKTKASDVYSFAILVYEIMTKQYPFYGRNIMNICYIVSINGERPEFTNPIPKAYKDLIEKCWKQESNERLTMEEVVQELKNNSGFITENVDEKLYRSYIDIMEQQIQGKDTSEIQNKLFPKYSLDKIYKEYEDSEYSSMPESIQNIENFEKDEPIRRGEFANVYKVVDKKTCKQYSATVSNHAEHFKDDEIEKISDEAKKLSQLKHPAIQQFHGISLYNFKHEKRPVTINEYCQNVTLFNILRNERKANATPKLNATNRLIIIYGIASAMSYLHSHDILHPNLNPRNIFVDKEFQPKLTEIGFYTQPTNTQTTSKRASLRISYLHWAPEILQSQSNNEKSDVYAFSLIVFELITKKVPFPEISSMNQLYMKIVGQKYRPLIDESVPAAYKKLIEDCWSENQEDRPSFMQIVEMLENDKQFLTNEVDESKYYKYIKYIKTSQI